MERREIFKHMLMASGAGLAGLTPGLSLAQEKKDVQPAKLDMLAGQEGGALNPREAHAYAMGMQAFLYGFPLVYMASLSFNFAKDPTGQQVPLNAFISPKDFVATSNFRNLCSTSAAPISASSAQVTLSRATSAAIAGGTRHVAIAETRRTR